jgi:4a-hydroxytetrahydrobiopterin dehydratase
MGRQFFAPDSFKRRKVLVHLLLHGRIAMDTIPEIELRNALSNRLRDWSLKDNMIERRFEFPSFKLAMDFVNKVACVAEDMNHHPDIAINFNKVTMALTSHDSGGITRRDLMLAGKINEIAPELMNPSRLKTA